MAHTPATVALCASLPRSAAPPSRRLGAAARVPITVPITWIADLHTLVAASADAADSATEFAVAIDPAWLDSRQTLRESLGRARDAWPALEAAVLRSTALRHHDVVAEAGIRVVVTDVVDTTTTSRGSRRPAPPGWPCRNVAWGLWEVRLPTTACSPAWGWLPGLGSTPSARRGSLQVLCAEADSPRLQGWHDWTARRGVRGDVSAVTLSGLRGLLEGDRRAALAGSVLRAA